MSAITVLGDWRLGVPLALVSMVLWLRYRWTWAGYVPFLIPTLGVIYILKVIDPPLLGADSPSGHAAQAMFLAMVALITIYRAQWQLSIFTAMIVASLAGWVVLSRVYLGEHTYPEVLCGGFVGALGALIPQALALWGESKRRSVRR